MTQTSMNTPYAKRVAEKFREAQNYLKNNGFSRSTKHLLEDLREFNKSGMPSYEKLKNDDGLRMLIRVIYESITD